MSNKVSIIIPCYNKGKYVADSINSALAQTYDNIEIIIVNDASTDNSAEVIQPYADKYDNIKFLNETNNSGVVVSRNKAIDIASGEYILPLDADDTIEPSYVEKAVKVLDENKNIGIVYCKAMLMGVENTEWVMPEFNETNFLYNNCIFATALFRKSDFIKAGGYKEFGWEDWDLWISILELGLTPYRIDEFLFNYRQLEENSRVKSENKNKDNLKKALIKNHIDFYLNNSNVFENVIKAGELSEKMSFLEHELKQYTKRYKKYKKLFKLFVVISICEFVLLIYFLLSNFGGSL